MTEATAKPLDANVRELDVPIHWEGQESHILLGKMTWGNQRDMITYAVGKVRVLGGETPQMELDLARMKEGIVIYSIKSAPFTVNAENIGKLDAQEFNTLYTKASELNPFQGFF